MKRPFSELLSEYLEGTLPADEAEDFFAQVGESRELLSGVIDERAAMEQLLPVNRERTVRMMGRLAAALQGIEERRVTADERRTEERRVTSEEHETQKERGIEEKKERRPGVLAGLPRWEWVAAASVLLLVAGAYGWHSRHGKDKAGDLTAQQVVVAPGHKGAILTLSNGTQMVLDSLRNGLVTAQSGANVMLKNGALAYDPNGEKPADIAYNTMTTPRGRLFQLTLPDGSKVWLNAESSIRFPTSFTGKERLVDLKGEAYFEVVHQVETPFRVRINGQEEVDVLGTSFNINAYADEGSRKTTLLEGSVRVMAEGQDGVVIKPGQQAQVGSSITVADNIDLDKVMAWKNGAFNFEGLSLEAAMRQLERWYDIKVRYEDGVPDVRFGGKIGRDNSLGDLLQILSGTKLKFRIENGHELVIMK